MTAWLSATVSLVQMGPREELGGIITTLGRDKRMSQADCVLMTCQLTLEWYAEVKMPLLRYPNL